MEFSIQRVTTMAEARRAKIAAMVSRSTILLGVVGSTLHGLAVNDGLEDRDELGVCVEDMDETISFDPWKGTYVYRTAEERQKAETGVSSRTHAPRSYAGDLDLVVHSLRKYLSLALKGNPTILNLLFVPESQLQTCDALGSQLRELTPKIVSRRASEAFLAYMRNQYHRLTGDRGQKDVNRPDLVEKYGFDTKYAMHVLRLGIQGQEIVSTGRLTFPVPEPHRSFLIGVRTGQFSFQDVLQAAEMSMRTLEMLVKEEKYLPAEPDYAAVESWMCGVYLEAWKARDFDRRVREGKLNYAI